MNNVILSWNWRNSSFVIGPAGSLQSAAWVRITWHNTDSKTRSAMLLSIINASLIFGDLRYLFYIMPGSYGAFFGLIAGPLGVCASNSKKTSRMKCQWIAFIVLVRNIHGQCRLCYMGVVCITKQPGPRLGPQATLVMADKLWAITYGSLIVWGVRWALQKELKNSYRSIHSPLHFSHKLWPIIAFFISVSSR